MAKQKKTKSSIDVIPAERIENKIYLIRGKKVMLDRDLAELYGVETRALNQAVKRNIDRFPDDFLLFLTREEIERISQNVISSGLKFSKSVYAFTQEGVAMLSGVLHSKRAVMVNIAIMRAFIRLREFLLQNKDLARKIENLERQFGKRFEAHDKKIAIIFEAIRALLGEEEKKANKEPLGFYPRK